MRSLRQTYRDFRRVSKIVTNWPLIILHHLHIKKTPVLKLRNGSRFIYVPKAFSIEHFVEKPYDKLNVKNRIVIDAGAYAGDSAIFFALKGAQHVYALEPYPFALSIAKINIELNGLNSKVSLMSAAVAAENGYLYLDENKKGPSANLKSKGNLKTRLITVQSLLDELSISDAVLKMDIEGAEVCLLDIDKKTLNVFSEIIIEYHSEGYQALQSKLKACGYRTTLLDIRGIETVNPPNNNGLIYAVLAS